MRVCTFVSVRLQSLSFLCLSLGLVFMPEHALQFYFFFFVSILHCGSEKSQQKQKKKYSSLAVEADDDECNTHSFLPYKCNKIKERHAALSKHNKSPVQQSSYSSELLYKLILKSLKPFSIVRYLVL